MSASLTQCPSEDVLESIALGHISPPEIELHLSACETCRAALARIREDNTFLGSFAVGGALPAPRDPETGVEIEIPGYQIIREVRRGGQGVVYLALQRSTRREVAIKVMKQGPFATLADRARFTREIETLGRLNHPNIIAVHDAGMVAGFHYFVMNYVDGRPFDEAVFGEGSPAADAVPAASPDSGSHDSSSRTSLGGRNRPPRIAAALNAFIKVCDAVHAAHLRGVIHRDLKPSNIRIDAGGEPYVLDFGLAKSIDDDVEPAAALDAGARASRSVGRAWATQTGQFVGSLPWASPEQVEGSSSRIDLRTDVYSLGAILFQILTGALPFDVDSSNIRDTLDNIIEREPPRPSSVVGGPGGRLIDDELDTIVLKCLSKDRDRRYQSAGDLARDLRRYLAGEPIEAKRDSAMYVLRKTLRRYRRRVAAAAAFAVSLAVFCIVLAVLYRRSARLEREAVHSAAALSDMLTAGNIEQGRMAGMIGNLEQAEHLLWTEMLTRRVPGESALQLVDPPGSVEVHWALWELYRRHACVRTLTPQPTLPRRAVVADDGRSIWTGDRLGLVQKIDPLGSVIDSYSCVPGGEFGAPVVDPAGRVVINYDRRRYLVWRRDAGTRPIIEIPAPLAVAEAEALSMSPTGRRISVLSEGLATICSTDSAAEVARIRDPAGLAAVAFSHDDRLLATRNRTGGVRILDLATRQVVVEMPSAPAGEVLQSVGELLFSPDDRYLADAWLALAGRVWDLRADPPVAVELSERAGNHRVLAFSPDGRLLAVGDLVGTLRIFDARTGRRLSSVVAHPGRIRQVSFSGDGREVCTCGEGDVRFWEATPDPDSKIIRIDGDMFHCLDISPDGKWWAAGGTSRKLQLVDRSTQVATSIAFGGDSTVSSVAISPDGDRVAASTYGNLLCVWFAHRPNDVPMRIAHSGRVSHLTFSPDGAQLAAACDDGVVRMWRAQDGSNLREFRGAADRVPQIAFDPDGGHLAGVVRNGAILMWNCATGDVVLKTSLSINALRAVRFLDHGRRLVVGGADRDLQVLDSSDGHKVATLVGHNQEIYCMDVSPAGDLIASGDSGGAVRLWHAGLMRPLATLDGHAASVMAVRFAPDGKALFSASSDGTIREWDLTYFDKHIAGQVDAQLRRLGPALSDSVKARAWREWALSVLVAPRAAPPNLSADPGL